MKGFILELENKPGAWAETAEKIADKGVNLLGCGLTNDGHGYIGFVTSDDASTKEALDDIRGKYRELRCYRYRSSMSQGPRRSLHAS